MPVADGKGKSGVAVVAVVNGNVPMVALEKFAVIVGAAVIWANGGNGATAVSCEDELLGAK